MKINASSLSPYFYIKKFISESLRSKMKDINEYVAKVKQRITDDDFQDISFGSECIYMYLEDNIGAKIFLEEKDRDFSFDLQKKASLKVLGPDIFDKFEIELFTINHDIEFGLKDAYKRRYFCYITEHVPSLLDMDKKCSEEELIELSVQLEKLGIICLDMEDRNLGYSENNLVCIDFGPFSVKKSKNFR